MSKNLIIIWMILIIPCYLCQSRIGYDTFEVSKDKNGIDWMYIASNHTLIFDNLDKSTSGFNLYFPFVLIDTFDVPTFYLILKNKNNIVINRSGDIIILSAIEFRGSPGSELVILGDGELNIKLDTGNKDMYEINGIYMSYSRLTIKDNAKINIIMSNCRKIRGINLFDGNLNMTGNSQISLYIDKYKDESYGIRCGSLYLSDNTTINSTLLNSSNTLTNHWLLSGNFELSNNTNVTFITKGTLTLPNDFFNYIGKNPIIINAVETLEEFKANHYLTQKDKNEPIILSNYYIEEIKQNNYSKFISLSFFILLNLILSI
jgi:hypothetical protein